MRKVYYGRDLDSRHLNHYAEERKDHKYIERIPIAGGKYKYIYDVATSVVPPVNKAIIDYATNETKKGVKQYVDETKQAIDKTSKAAKLITSRPIEVAGKVVAKKISDTKKTIDDAKELSRQTKQLATNASNQFTKAKTDITNSLATSFRTTRGHNENMHSMNQGVVKGERYNSTKGNNANMHSSNQGVVNGKTISQVKKEEKAKQKESLDKTLNAINPSNKTDKVSKAANDLNRKEFMNKLSSVGDNAKKAYDEAKEKQAKKEEVKNAAGKIVNRLNPVNAFKSPSIKGVVTGKKVESQKDTPSIKGVVTGKKNDTGHKGDWDYYEKQRRDLVKDFTYGEKVGKTKYDPSKVTNKSFTAGSGRLDNGTVDKFHTYATTALSANTRRKLIEDSYFNQFREDGLSSSDARVRAKRAAEDYLKRNMVKAYTK